MKKIIFSDYDKTFYLNDDDLVKNIDAVKRFQKAGNKFVIATGRSYPDYVDKMLHHQVPYDYLMLNHGSQILSKDLQVIKSDYLEASVVSKIYEIASGYESVYQILLFDDFKRHQELITENVTKIMIKSNSLEEAIEMNDLFNKTHEFNAKSYKLISGDHWLIEIISGDTNKSRAIEHLLEYEQIPEEAVYTIGDASNDVEMIKRFNGFGMVNSEECVLQVASKLYNSVSELINEILED